VHKNTGFYLNGIETFDDAGIIIGCHHYIDSILIQHGVRNVQVLEHDYSYYSRLLPGRVFSSVNNLRPDTPLIIATPFPGFTTVHPDYDNILQEAYEKNVEVHLDGAWLSCSKGISLNLHHPSIRSIGISLSKGYGASWNRVGVRYTKNTLDSDPITIFNKAKMAPESVVRNGILLLDNVPTDYLWTTYQDAYNEIVNECDLEPGNILFAAYTKDRQLISLSDAILSHRPD
jgi:hypothetical protein